MQIIFRTNHIWTYSGFSAVVYCFNPGNYKQVLRQIFEHKNTCPVNVLLHTVIIGYILQFFLIKLNNKYFQNIFIVFCSGLWFLDEGKGSGDSVEGIAKFTT